MPEPGPASDARRLPRILTAARAALGGKSGENVAWLLGGQVVGLLATFIATPIELDRMGSERYGAVVLLVGVIGYLLVLDVGSGWAVTRSVSRHLSRGEGQRAADALGSGLALVLAVGAIGTLAVFLLAPSFADLLRLETDTRPDVVTGLRVLALSLPLALAAGILAGVGRSLEMFRLAAVLSALNLILLNVAWVAVAGRSDDVVLVVGAQALIVVGGCLTWLIALWRRERALIVGARPHRHDIAELFRFGRQYTLTQVGYGGVTQADKPILGFVIPVSLMPQYTIPFAVASRATILSTPLATVLFPRLVEAAAHDREEELVDAGGRSIRLVSVVSGAALALMIFAGHPFLELWIDDSFASDAYPPLVALAIGFALHTVGSPAGVLIDARDRPELHARIVASGSAIGLLGGLVLGGIFGTPTAGSIGIACGLGFIGLGVLEASHRLAPAWSRWLIAKMAFVPWASLLLAGGGAALLAALTDLGPVPTLVIVLAATVTATAFLVRSSPDTGTQQSIDVQPAESAKSL